jgi:hypothetical protein
MKLFFTVMILALSFSLWGQDESLMQDAITKPSLSLRCKEMHKERSEKIKMQQRLSALLQRNQGLVKKSPKAREGLHAQLKSNQIRIRNELHLTNLQIDSIEENIIRSGCPGISL